MWGDALKKFFLKKIRIYMEVWTTPNKQPSLSLGGGGTPYVRFIYFKSFSHENEFVSFEEA